MPKLERLVAVWWRYAKSFFWHTVYCATYTSCRRTYTLLKIFLLVYGECYSVHEDWSALRWYWRRQIRRAEWVVCRELLPGCGTASEWKLSPPIYTTVNNLSLTSITSRQCELRNKHVDATNRSTFSLLREWQRGGVRLPPYFGQPQVSDKYGLFIWCSVRLSMTIKTRKLSEQLNKCVVFIQHDDAT